MMGRIALALAAALAVVAILPRPALACSPAIVTPSPVPVQGPDCALRIDMDEINAASLGAAVALGDGFLMQPLSEGNACYNRQYLLFHDCAARQVMVIGAEDHDVMLAHEAQGAGSGLERIRETALRVRDAGQRLDMDGLAALSRAEGFGAPQVLRTSQSLRFGGHTMPLSCACRRGPGQTG